MCFILYHIVVKTDFLLFAHTIFYQTTSLKRHILFFAHICVKRKDDKSVSLVTLDVENNGSLNTQLKNCIMNYDQVIIQQP